jgi:type II secretion system protein C
MLLAYVARRVPVVGIVTTVLCAVFAARTIGHLAEAGIVDEAQAATPVPRRPAAAPAVTPATRDHDALVARNMFCSDCGPAAAPSAPGAPTGVQVTALPLLLIATSVGTSPVATIRDTSTGAQGAYGVGDRLRGAGPIERIAGTTVQFRNEALGRSERIDLLAAERPAAAPTDAAPTATTSDEPWRKSIRAIDDHTFEVERSLVKELIASGTGAKVKGVRLAPHIQGGKLAGVRVAQARPDSMAAAVGLRTGDVIEVVDGVRLTSPDDMLTLMARLNTITGARVQGRRGGQPFELQYQLR